MWTIKILLNNKIIFLFYTKMRKPTREPIFNPSELNRILPSYLLNEVDEDVKDKKSKEESILDSFSNGKNVSKIFFIKLILNYIFKINYFIGY